jgi:hypothetical protein
VVQHKEFSSGDSRGSLLTVEGYAEMCVGHKQCAYWLRVASIKGAASDSVNRISVLQLGQRIVGSVMTFDPYPLHMKTLVL